MFYKLINFIIQFRIFNTLKLGPPEVYGHITLCLLQIVSYKGKEIATYSLDLMCSRQIKRFMQAENVLFD